MTEPNPLTLWLNLKPYEALGDKDRLNELTEFLEHATRPKSQHQKLLFSQAMQGGPIAALALGVDILDTSARENVGMSWVFVAAARGNALASLLLAQMLAHKSRTAEREAFEPLSAERRKEDAALRARAEAWATWHPPVLKPGYKDDGVAEQMKMVLGLLDGAKSADMVQSNVSVSPSPAPFVNGPCRTVATAINDSQSREGKELARAYKDLLVPLPLRGGGLVADVVHDTMMEEFPWMLPTIERIADDLRLREMAGTGWARFRPILLVGDPGVGKTRFAKRLSQVMDLGYGEISAAGSADNMMLKGTARGWHTSKPAYPLLVMQQCRSANPVILIDEIDKAGGSARNGDMRHTLLTMLEPQSSRNWPDECLLSSVDLSGISWVLTANRADRIQGTLLSRVATIKAGRPGPEHFDIILQGILRDIAQDLEIMPEQLPAPDPEALAMIRHEFMKGHWSIRNIKNAVTTLLAHAPHNRPVH